MARVGTGLTGFSRDLRWFFISLGGKFREFSGCSIGSDPGRRVGLVLRFVFVDVGLVKIIIDIVPEAG